MPTVVPIEIVDALCVASISGIKHRIMWHILRANLVRSRTADSRLKNVMTACDIAEGIDASCRTTERALTELVQAHVVLQRPSSLGKLFTYEVNKNVDEWFR